MKKVLLKITVFTITLIATGYSNSIVFGQHTHPVTLDQEEESTDNEASIIDRSFEINAALIAANSHLSAIDRGEYSMIGYSKIFETAVAQEQWRKQLAAFRDPLGKVVSRGVLTSNYQSSLPGMPAGDYVIIQYKTKFQNKEHAVETLTMILEGILVSDWKLGGYSIK